VKEERESRIGCALMEVGAPRWEQERPPKKDYNLVPKIAIMGDRRNGKKETEQGSQKDIH
jgi:hypothetical protein